jgi:hypothetical protein
MNFFGKKKSTSIEENVLSNDVLKKELDNARRTINEQNIKLNSAFEKIENFSKIIYKYQLELLD